MAKHLLDLYVAATTDELLNGSFLLPGEVSQLFYTVQEHSGFGADAVAEEKQIEADGLVVRCTTTGSCMASGHPSF